MARTVNPAAQLARRTLLLDAMLRLVAERGYPQVSLQDLADDVGVSKGVIYHYYASKEELLDALVARLAEAAQARLRPALEAEGASALERLRGYLSASQEWKAAQRPLILGLLRAWRTDENVVVRQKLAAASLRDTTLLLAPVVRQGVAEGVFRSTQPELTAAFIASVGLGATDTFVDVLLLPASDAAAARLDGLLEAYTEAVERLLGAPAGSLRVFDPELSHAWMGALQPPESR